MIFDISFGNIENMNNELAIKTNNFLLKLPPYFELNQLMSVIWFSGKSTTKKICIHIYFFQTMARHSSHSKYSVYILYDIATFQLINIKR